MPSQIATRVIKITPEDSKKVKRIRNLCIKMQTLSVCPDTTTVPDFRWKNANVSRVQGLCLTIYIDFGEGGLEAQPE